ncbi:MAG: extracellular solute-binding protein [Clostridia bacterium]|nr:extracellular solute-binding protein [Clostridia bacterium]
MTKRILALLISLLMIVPFAACGAEDTGKQPAETTPQIIDTTDAPETPPADSEPDYKPVLPEVRFEGDQLVIIHLDPNSSTYAEIYLQAEEITGDLLNDAVYKRNMALEEKYGIEFVNVINSKPHTAISTAAQSQSDEYDLAFPQMMNIGSLITSGYLYNFHEFNHVDFSKPYWDKNFNEDITLYGKLYAAVSDISLMTLIGTRGIIFNRDMAKENNLGDPYDLVKNNQWTLDKMIEMAHSVSEDLNGDQTFDDMDRYGMLTESSNFRYFVVASGIDIFTRDADGNPVAGFMNEKTISVIEKWRTVYKDETHAIDYNDLGGTAGAAALDGSKWNYGRQLFARGQILFLQNSPTTFSKITEYGMEQEYGILPQPKYDANQDEYYCMPDYNTTVLVVPSTNDDYDKLDILLEDMAYQSNQTILPTYYETVIKIRRSPVPEVAEMLEIIRNSICYHVGMIYNIDADSLISQASSSGNITSVFKVGEKRLNAQIKKVAETIQNLP